MWKMRAMGATSYLRSDQDPKINGCLAWLECLGAKDAKLIIYINGHFKKKLQKKKKKGTQVQGTPAVHTALFFALPFGFLRNFYALGTSFAPSRPLDKFPWTSSLWQGGGTLGKSKSQTAGLCRFKWPSGPKEYLAFTLQDGWTTLGAKPDLKSPLSTLSTYSNLPWSV